MTLRSASICCLTLLLAAGMAAQETPKTCAPTSDSGVYRIGGPITPPTVLSRTDPEFSKEARKKKLAGDTTLALVVDIEGMPQKIRVIKSAAERYKKQKDRDAAQTLDAKAIEALESYRFKPAVRDGKPVSVEMNIVVNFRIY